MLAQNFYRGKTLVRQDLGNGQVFSYDYISTLGGPYADSVIVTLPDSTKTTVEVGSSVPDLLKHPRN